MLKIAKEYPHRGPMQQFRLDEAAAFDCFRCGETKKAKLRTVYGGDQARLLCNGCYGRLLSIFDIKAGTGTDDEKAAGLADLLLGLASVDEARRAARLLQVAQKHVDVMNPLAVRFLGTAEHVAASLHDKPNLDWSAAIIGLCKAVEVETVSRLVDPLRATCSGLNLDDDMKDKDLGRVAAYCGGRSNKPPEIGPSRHSLQTAANSQRRAATSPLLQSLQRLMATWPASSWLLSSAGLVDKLDILASRFRNPAAHIDELGRDDYLACRELVAGTDGLLWHLIVSTTR